MVFSLFILSRSYYIMYCKRLQRNHMKRQSRTMALGAVVRYWWWPATAVVVALLLLLLPEVVQSFLPASSLSRQRSILVKNTPASSTVSVLEAVRRKKSTNLPVGSEILSETAAVQKFTPDPTDPANDFDLLPDNKSTTSTAANKNADEPDECWIGTPGDANCLPFHLVTLPRHSHPGVNAILEQTEHRLQSIHCESKAVIAPQQIHDARNKGKDHERIYANNYVDLGKIDTYVICVVVYMCVAVWMGSVFFFYTGSCIVLCDSFPCFMLVKNQMLLTFDSFMTHQHWL